MLVKLAILLVLGTLALLLLGRLASVWWRYRGRRVIICPENQTPAGVTVNTRHAAATALATAPQLFLSSCSRWPERAGCGQECLAQVATSPEDCLVRNILTRWYKGKACVSCGRPIGEIDWVKARPAMLGSGKVSVEWGQVPADRLHEVLAASRPLCFACHMANKLVREHPELVVDRSSSNPI